MDEKCSITLEYFSSKIFFGWNNVYIYAKVRKADKSKIGYNYAQRVKVDDIRTLNLVL